MSVSVLAMMLSPTFYCGADMNRNLSDGDRRAVDFLMNHTESQSPMHAFDTASQIEPSRLQAAEKIFAVLQSFPAPEPSPDLVARTIRRVEKATSRMASPASIDINNQLSDSGHPIA
jgi:hypothetical protein